MEKTLYSIDRFDGELAVLLADDGGELQVNRTSLPQGVKEGHCVWQQEGVFCAAPEETAARAKKAKDLLAALLQQK